jgi:hypothetical protein
VACSHKINKYGVFELKPREDLMPGTCRKGEVVEY